MREIKFRGKLIKAYLGAPAGSWLTMSKDDSIFPGEEGNIKFLNGFWKAVAYGFIDPATVGQWTGLKDCRGVEIYEGDRLQWKTYTACRRWWSRTEEIPIIEEEVRKQREDVSVDSGVVKFDDGEFCTTYPITPRDIKRGERYTSGAGNGCDVESKYWGFEVIGNIHEVTK